MAAFPQRVANGISEGGSSYTFKGSGTISWTDWFARTANTTFNVPLTDNGGGLRFDAKGFLYFKAANTHTGGTWVKGSGSSLNPFAITIGDRAFGAVPAQKQTNIVWQGGNVALYAENGAKTLHANRTIRVVDGASAEELATAEWRNPAGLKVPAGGFLQICLELGATNALSSPRVTCVRVAAGR